MSRPPAKRQPYRATADRRLQIAQAAIICLERDGYARLTARSVAAEVGLSLGHITYHFRDMDELLGEAYRVASAELREATARALDHTGCDPIERLAAFLRAGFTPRILNRPYLRLRIDLWSAALAHPTIAEIEADLYQSYRSDLLTHLRAVARHEAPEAQLTSCTDAIMALLDGLWLDWMRRGEAQAIDNGLAACLDLARALRG